MPWSFFFHPVCSWTGLRLGRALLGVALAFGLMLGSNAYADYYRFVDSNAGTFIAYYSSAQSACATVGGRYHYAPNDSDWSSVTWESGSGNCQVSSGGQVFNTGYSAYLVSGAPPLSCTAPQVSTPDSSGKYVCAAPAAPSCTDPSVMNKYRGAGWTTASSQYGAPDYICIKGCQYDPGSLTVTYPNSSSVTGYTSGGRAGSSSGKSCDLANWPQITIDVDMSNATDVSKLPPSPEHCAAQGRFFGQVNGVDVCSPAVPGGSTTSTSNSSSSTNDSPASSPAASSTNDTTTRTTCTDTTCTTTTVVAVGGGGGVAGGASSPGASTCQSGQGASAVAGTCTTTTTTSRDDYCKANPKAPQCEQDSASGGADCGSPPTCSGDAISCAILAQQWNTRCELQKHDDSTDFGAKLANGQDPMGGQLPTPGKADQVDMSSKFSNVDDMGIAAQCLGNIDVPLSLPGGGWNLHIDTTPLCDIGKLLGYLNMLGTMMLCAYMLKGSF